MNKFSILTCAVALVACASSANAVEVMGTECEQVVTGERGDILVKCPVTDALTEIRNGTPNAKFLSVNMDVFDYSLLSTDTDSIYVNIVNEYCPEGQVGYRVAIAGATDFENYYAVSKCVATE